MKESPCSKWRSTRQIHTSYILTTCPQTTESHATPFREDDNASVEYLAVFLKAWRTDTNCLKARYRGAEY